MMNSLFKTDGGEGSLICCSPKVNSPKSLSVFLPVAGNTQALEESASPVKHFAMFKLACCPGTA